MAKSGHALSRRADRLRWKQVYEGSRIARRARIKKVCLLVGLCLMVVVVLYGAYRLLWPWLTEPGPPKRVDWGNIPTWFSAIATVSALSLALFSTLSEFKHRLATDSAERERQALLVRSEVSLLSGQASLRNLSKGPIFDIRVCGYVTMKHRAYVLSPASDVVIETDFQSFGSVHPGGDVVLRVPAKISVAWRSPHSVSRNLADRVFVTITFYDAEGRHWLKECRLHGDGEDVLVPLLNQ